MKNAILLALHALDLQLHNVIHAILLIFGLLIQKLVQTPALINIGKILLDIPVTYAIIIVLLVNKIM